MSSSLSQRSYGISSVSGGQYGGGRRAQSVYGGAGGRGVQMSYASSSFGLSGGGGGGGGFGGGSSSGFGLSGGSGFGGGGFGGGGFAMSGGGGSGVGLGVNEKATMQNLNDRLSNYLEKVRSLETINAQLERQIREWYDKQSTGLVTRDYSKFLAIIAEIRGKINAATLGNARILLQIDNAKLATEDFRLKYENEMSMRMSVEADLAGLRKVLDELTMARTDLEMQIEGLKEELVYLKRNHEEELAAIRANMGTNSVNVEVDAKPQADLTASIDEIRSQYEAITDKNRRDMDVWYQAKFDEMNKHVASSTETLQTSHSEITELKRTVQAMQIELQSQLSLKAALEGTLYETDCRYSLQLSQMQAIVNSLECELGQMKMDIERQANEYKMLLDIKTRLEMEIAEYRRLMDGESGGRKHSVQEIRVVKEVVKEIRKPKVTKRVRTVVEEIIDGKVVSSVVEEDLIE